MSPVSYDKGHPDDLEWPKKVPYPVPATARYRITSERSHLMVKMNGVVIETLRLPKVYAFHIQILNANIACEQNRRYAMSAYPSSRLRFAIQLREKFVEELRAAQNVPNISEWHSKILDPVLHRAIYGMENTPYYRRIYTKYCKDSGGRIKPYDQDVFQCGECLNLISSV